MEQAVKHAMTAANLQPGDLGNISTLFHLMRWACHWHQIDDVSRVLEHLVSQSLTLEFVKPHL